MTPTTAPPTNKDSYPAFFSVRTLHLLTLCCFAITQPLLTALKDQAVYLRDQQIAWIEVGVLLAFLTIVLPVTVVFIDQIIFQLSRWTFGYGRNVMFVVMLAVLLLSLLRPYIAMNWLVTRGIATFVSFAIVIPSSCLLSFYFERSRWLRSWLTYASVCLVVFPGAFLWQFRAMRESAAPIDDRVAVSNPVPVVFVVFDEFSGTTLMNEQLEIDSARFPQFARLAKLSTWYRKTTTVHPRTGTAVPAILSGRFPVAERSPLDVDYPGNLFQVIELSKDYDMAIFEPATRLCPQSLTRIPEPELASSQKCIDLLHTMATVYPRLIFARDTPFELPVIPKTWFGIHANTIQRSERRSEITEGLFNYNRGLNRDQQLQHFLKCLLPSDRPRFCFIHAMIPHYPWCFLPTGEKYQSEEFFAHSPPIAQGEMGEDWPSEPIIAHRYEHRYRLQVGYVDRFIGELLDRLEETGMMDRCLLIVTSDHGVAFRPGHSRRHPDADNVADIMSVPLFIKMPGQSEGKIDDRNVESVDLLPTVAEVLGIKLSEPVDGIPVSSEPRRPRKTIYFNSTMTVVEPDFPQLTSAVRRQTSLFGTEPLEQMPAAAASHLDWHGQSVSNFVIDHRDIPFDSLSPHSMDASLENATQKMIVPCLVCGILHNSDVPDASGETVVAIDDVIQDTSRLAWYSTGHHYFEFLLPQSAVAGRERKIDFYLTVRSQNKVNLRPLKAR